MSLFPADAARDFAGDYFLMLQDSAGLHQAHAVQIPATIRRIPLSSFSPEINPVEHIRTFLREK